ncbi:MAG: c-type cytochrome biogenesis protein CcsB [Deltaproteobacteria bacterium]|nr:c-type cytochrome biogenesis protein CcsB [Deltaproteobacteria bacterium]
MGNIELNTYLAFGYLLWIIGYLITFVVIRERTSLSRFFWLALIVLWILHTVSIGLRWVESYQLGIGHAPLSNLYESLVFFSWSVALALIVVWRRFGTDLVALLGVPIVFLILASTFLIDPSIRPLIPALQSNWLVAHVFTCFLGYSGFAVSFVAALLLLLAKSSDKAANLLPRKAILDEIVYRSIMIGFPLLTLGIITGAAWAEHAWGTYWSWDPKETWSLVTWLVYAGFLHARLSRGWSGGRTALLSVIGFCAVMFTYFGVNYLPGLHSYF